MRLQNQQVQKGVCLQAPVDSWEVLAGRSKADSPEPLNCGCEKNVGSWGRGEVERSRGMPLPGLVIEV